MNEREAMKLALGALEEVKSWKSPTRWDGCFDKEITALKQALEQPEPEPVAWMITTEMQDGTHSTFPVSGRFKDAKNSCDFGEPVPLYTSPPKTLPEPSKPNLRRKTDE